MVGRMGFIDDGVTSRAGRFLWTSGRVLEQPVTVPAALRALLISGSPRPRAAASQDRYTRDYALAGRPRSSWPRS
jgi:hypothetical protein